MLLTLISFLGVLVVLIVVHELGHLTAAKAMKVPVLEFGLGYPPRLLGITWKGTKYSINAIPLGGFVRMPGETDPTQPNALAARGVGTRFLVLSAGSVMNLLLPVVIFALIFALPQRTYVGSVTVQEVASDSPAAMAGLLPGDRILSVDGHAVGNNSDLAYRLHLRLGAGTTWGVQRGDQKLTVSVVPRWKPPAGQGSTGVLIATEDVHEVMQRYTWWRAIGMGFQRISEILVLTKNEVTRWIIGASTPTVAGPVGIAQMTGEVARAGGFMPLLEFTALLSINLAILNILPIPMLDGGRLMFVLIEFVRRGKRVPPQREGLVHLIGFILLIGLAVVITFFDIMRVARGESFIPK
jgi:regulator of sigma E protease